MTGSITTAELDVQEYLSYKNTYGYIWAKILTFTPKILSRTKICHTVEQKLGKYSR